MGDYAQARELLSIGKIVRRKAWGDGKAVIAASFGGSGIGFPILMYGTGGLRTVHDETGVMQRYWPTDEDEAATDWQSSEFKVELTILDDLQ
jgi:hypothetical protein